MTSELYKRSLYLNKNIDYLFGVDICEYDIESAGLNIIKYYGLLPQDRITYLEGMSKEARNKQIGIYQRDDSVFKEALSEGFVNIRKEFFDLNEIEDDDILSIKKDAIFTLDRRMRHTKIGNVTFKRKHSYTSYLYLDKKEIYVNTLMNTVEIKGLTDCSEHEGYMFDFFKRFCAINENSPNQDIAIDFILEFIQKYRNKELPNGYYRRLSKDNNFVVYDELNDEWIEVNDIEVNEYDVDISYNYINYLIPLASIYL